MPTQGSKKILAVMEDLMFTVKINDVAKRLSLLPEFVQTEADALAKAKEHPLLVIIDLNSRAVDAVDLIAKLKQNNGEGKKTPVIGFVSHVQADLKMRAQEAGCDLVMARSAFSQNLPTLLKRHAGIV